MLKKHKIKIIQRINGQNHWTNIRLIDEHENYHSGIQVVSGKWRHTNESYNSKEIRFCSWHEDWLRWRWTGGAYGGNFEIGADTNRGSHQKAEERDFQIYIFLANGKRIPGSEFDITGPFQQATGTLYNGSTLNEFQKGNILWEVEPYW